MTHNQARELVRAARRRMAITDPERLPLLAALVRDDPVEIASLAEANPEPLPAPPGPPWDLARHLDRYDPTEGDWLRSARVQFSAGLERSAQERAGQETLKEKPGPVPAQRPLAPVAAGPLFARAGGDR